MGAQLKQNFLDHIAVYALDTIDQQHLVEVLFALSQIPALIENKAEDVFVPNHGGVAFGVHLTHHLVEVAVQQPDNSGLVAFVFLPLLAVDVPAVMVVLQVRCLPNGVYLHLLEGQLVHTLHDRQIYQFGADRPV